MDLHDLIDEYFAVGVGDQLYRVLLETVRAVVRGHSYPVSYSPSNHWDEDAYTALAADWATEKLLRQGHLEHLLLVNESVRGFRYGLELSFTHFLISRRQRTELSNLYQRTSTILEQDDRFHVYVDATRKADRLWGLATWQQPDIFVGPDEELIRAAFRIPGFEPMRYRADARKHSPVLGAPELRAFIVRFFEEIGRLLRLGHLQLVFKYRFALLEAEVVSLDQPLPSPSDGEQTILDRYASGNKTEDEIVVQETATAIMRELSARQQLALTEYARLDATIEGVAKRLGCSKSTAENEIKRALNTIRAHVESAEEAQVAYARVMELLSSALQR